MSTQPPSSLPPKKRPVADAADATASGGANANTNAAAEAPLRVTIDPLNLLGTHEPRDRFGDPLPPRPAKEPRLAAPADDADHEDERAAAARDSDSDAGEEEEAAAGDGPPTTSAGIAAARRTGKIHGLVAEYRAPRIGAQYQAAVPPLPSAQAPAVAASAAARPPPPPPQDD